MTTQDQGSQHDADPKDDKPPVEACYKLACWIKAKLGGLGPIEYFTFVLALSTLMQVWAFIESERAFVYADFPQIQQLNDGRQIVISITYRNSGRSTAFVKKHNISTKLVPDLPKFPRYETGVETLPFRITPQNKVNLRNTSDESIPKGSIAALTEGATTKLYVFGYLKYSDDYSWIFGNRTIGYCFVYTERGGFETCDVQYAAYSYYH